MNPIFFLKKPKTKKTHLQSAPVRSINTLPSIIMQCKTSFPVRSMKGLGDDPNDCAVRIGLEAVILAMGVERMFFNFLIWRTGLLQVIFAWTLLVEVERFFFLGAPGSLPRLNSCFVRAMVAGMGCRRWLHNWSIYVTLFTISQFMWSLTTISASRLCYHKAPNWISRPLVSRRQRELLIDSHQISHLD